MMSLEDLFARQRQTWATCPDWVQTMILKNIRDTIKAKIEKEHGIQEDYREGFTDDWEAVAAEVQSQMSRRPPNGQLLGFRHPQLHAFRHVQLHRVRVKLPATCVLEPWLEPQITETIHRKLSGLSITTQVSATRLLNFLDSDLKTPNGSLEVAGGLTLDNTVTPTTLR